jgi:hypothetical protein
MRNQSTLLKGRMHELVLNTVDKGYSVIITMPNKMSLVRTIAADPYLS